MMLHCSYITTSPSVYQIPFYYHTISERSACKASIFHVATSFADIDQFCGLWDKVQHLQAKQLEKHSHTQLMQYRYTFHWLHMVVQPTRLETKCTLNWGSLSETDTSQEKKHVLWKGGTSHTSSHATLFPSLFRDQAIM